ncbi:MAG: hydantoinase B/oxoprolinase family protein, partial [Phycicoccus sp.]
MSDAPRHHDSASDHAPGTASSGTASSGTASSGTASSGTASSDVVNPAGMPTPYEHGGRLTLPGTGVDPIVVEIVQGTLASVEREVETAIARTSRSPMIRDAHDFRAGIHDR